MSAREVDSTTGAATTGRTVASRRLEREMHHPAGMSAAFVDSERTTTVVDIPGPSPRERRRCDATFSVLSGPDVGALHTVDRPAVEIGRDALDGICIDGEGVSRRHARVSVMDGAAYLEDLGSTNGTYVNDIRIEGPVRLAEGDRIQIGAERLMRFAWLDAEAQEASRRCFEMSLRDGLTGLYNRRAFDERLAQEVAFTDRHGTALSVILLDLDHFKLINDRFGHPCGDRVLQLVAASLVASVRLEDLVARYGGEELVVVVRGIPADGVRVLAERLRARVEALDVVWDGRRVPVTASLGVAHAGRGAPATAAAVLSVADQALYEAKRGGRNRVVIADR